MNKVENKETLTYTQCTNNTAKEIKIENTSYTQQCKSSQNNGQQVRENKVLSRRKKSDNTFKV